MRRLRFRDAEDKERCFEDVRRSATERKGGRELWKISWAKDEVRSKKEEEGGSKQEKCLPVCSAPRAEKQN